MQNQIEAMDEEEKALIEEERLVMEELKIISEKHMHVDITYEKVVNNLYGMMKKNKSNEDQSSLSADYERYLNSSLINISQFVLNNKKEDFEDILKNKGFTEFSHLVKPDKFIKTRNKEEGLKEVKQKATVEEYDYGDPEIENEDKRIKEVTDALIEENKRSIVSFCVIYI